MKRTSRLVMAVLLGLLVTGSARAEVVALICTGAVFLGGEGRVLIDTEKKQMGGVSEETTTNPISGSSCTAKMSVDDSAYRMEQKCTKGDDWTLTIQSVDRSTGRYIYIQAAKNLEQKSYISTCRKVDNKPSF